MNKQFLSLIILILLCNFALAETTMNPLTKGLADLLYCRQNGNCNLSNLNVINTTITNTNVTGFINAYGYLINGTPISSGNSSFNQSLTDSLYNLSNYVRKSGDNMTGILGFNYNNINSSINPIAKMLNFPKYGLNINNISIYDSVSATKSIKHIYDSSYNDVYRINYDTDSLFYVKTLSYDSSGSDSFMSIGRGNYLDPSSYCYASTQEGMALQCGGYNNHLRGKNIIVDGNSISAFGDSGSIVGGYSLGLGNSFIIDSGYGGTDGGMCIGGNDAQCLDAGSDCIGTSCHNSVADSLKIYDYGDITVETPTTNIYLTTSASGKVTINNNLQVGTNLYIGDTNHYINKTGNDMRFKVPSNGSFVFFNATRAATLIAGRYLTMTDSYDFEQEGSAIEKFERYDNLTTSNGSILHENYFGYTMCDIPDEDKPYIWNETKTEWYYEVLKDSKGNWIRNSTGGITKWKVYNTTIIQHIEYPSTKQVACVNLGKEAVGLGAAIKEYSTAAKVVAYEGIAEPALETKAVVTDELYFASEPSKKKTDSFSLADLKYPEERIKDGKLDKTKFDSSVAVLASDKKKSISKTFIDAQSYIQNLEGYSALLRDEIYKRDVIIANLQSKSELIDRCIKEAKTFDDFKKCSVK